ncbi:CRISPR-associated protein, SAG0894 family [Fructilactobacillus fructivorans]|uniref:CRISPR-associated protein, SAG0894 family n=1 Tax=Fructilactobacillus fructivorans TaxID=1614 RepID=A0A0C1LZG5_9LACO|nr:CRISPR-associated protein, SAG0894 family [Fructilactobacillus fructivorans]
MSKENVKYNIGLDIGTNSIGWAATDEFNKLIHTKGHNAIGARLFKEGKSAAERRGFRTTRRRLSRRKWRLRLLNEIFDENGISDVDPSFFARMKQSNVSPRDDRKSFNGNILFDDKDFDDKKYHNEYSTIYHLRRALMTEDKKFDIRLIYLAMHHIIKYRGHFLNQANVNDFKGGEIDLASSFKALNEQFKNQGRALLLKDSDLGNDTQTLLDNSRSRNDRQKELSRILNIPNQDDDKDQAKLNKKATTEIIKAILGMKAKFDIIFGLEVDEPKDWSLTFNSDDFDDKISELEPQMTDEANEILLILKKLYFSINLSDILKDAETKKMADSLSDAMIARYDDHARHLKLLKQVAEQESGTEKGKALKQAYEEYVNGKNGKPVTADDFFKHVKNNLNDSAESQEI